MIKKKKGKEYLKIDFNWISVQVIHTRETKTDSRYFRGFFVVYLKRKRAL